jgi:hypothetical protein
MSIAGKLCQHDNDPTVALARMEKKKARIFRSFIVPCNKNKTAPGYRAAVESPFVYHITAC